MTFSPGSSTSDPLVLALLQIANLKHCHASAAVLCAGLPLVNGKLSPELLPRAAARMHMEASVQQRALETLPAYVLPCLALTRNEAAIVLLSVDVSLDRVTYLNAEGAKQEDSFAALQEMYAGYCVLFKEMARSDQRLQMPELEKPFAWFWRVLKVSRPIYRDVLLATLFINLFVVANPLFVMNVYDRVVPNNAIETLWALALGISVLYLFDLMLRHLRTYFLEVAGKKTDVVLSTQIFERVLGARYDVHPKSVGAFASQLKDFEAVRSFITSSTISALIDFPFVVIFLAVLLYIGGILVLVPLLLIPLILLNAWRVHLALKESIERSTQAATQKNASLVEALTNLETLKVIGGEASVLGRWDQAVGQNALWGMRVRLLSNGVTTFSYFVQQMSTVLVVLVGVYAIARHDLSMGALIASVILSGRALAPLAQISALLVQYHQSKLALLSIDELYKKEQERHANVDYVRPPKFTGKFEVRELEFSYPDETQPCLKNINLKVRAGEKIAIIGRIGSGKSTLQRLLLGLYRPTRGTILIDDVDIALIDPAEMRSAIAFAAQNSQLFYGTIRDNIVFGKTAVSEEELSEVCRISGVSQWLHAHPRGLDRLVGERGENLSGGQAQSLVLARALLGNKPLLILDEPTTSMDNSAEAQVLRELNTYCADKTLILITHKMALLALVDRLIVLDQGRIVADGEKNAVLDALKKGQLNVA